MDHPQPTAYYQPSGAESEADERRIVQSLELAGAIITQAAAMDETARPSVRRRRRRLGTLVEHPRAADFTVRLTDEVSRLTLPSRAARRFSQLVADADLAGFSRIDRTMLRVGARTAPLMPRLVMPLVHRRLRSESAGVILASEDPAFRRHISARSAAGYRCNVNVLGEAIVGDGEAHRRLEMVVDRLRRPDVDYVSVKISAICASIDVLAFDDTVRRVVERLRPLYRLAASFDPPKFVNLDMEEYRDLDLTMTAFRQILDEAEFRQLDAGLVLQAYLPDVRAAARDLGEWACRRRREGGGQTKIRLVKGANLAMETAAAELAGWVPAPLPTKADVDANYKAVLDILCEQQFDDAVRVGLASHNLFDVAWGLVLRDEMVAAGRPARIEFEMLEGMSPSQSEVVRSIAGDLLLYSPVVTRRDFSAAIAYLVRRLDENTSADNFLAHIFELGHDRDAYTTEANRFSTAVRARHALSPTPRRCQDRRQTATSGALHEPFLNAPDTDWTRAANRTWIERALMAPHPMTARATVSVDEAERSVERAVAARKPWSELGVEARAAIIDQVGDLFEAHRGRILATMCREAGKTVAQGDPEVSEAIDFARYYARESCRLAAVGGASASPLGTVVVTPPWNFPFAIPAGGVLAALAAGNTAILKPAPETVDTAHLIAELCWSAGVPGDVLQFVPAADDAAGRRLITHPDVGAVILTGAHATAAMFQEWRPDLRLHAETSGKNALVITATADVDEAVADLVSSAFGHAGQKCSAASIAIVEAPLYDDPVFLERVRDAAATLRVGSASDLGSDVGPLIGQPGDELARALMTLDPGESWLLEPRCLSADRRSWSPGVRLGVLSTSWFARTECFGPVLGIVRADDLDHAIAIQNSTDFGLTAGLHALDPNEIERWMERVEAGNLYVNRGITGAIVQRQPFGGWKRSAVGPTAKAGGPNYVATLGRWIDGDTEFDEVTAAFERWWQQVGSVERDATGLRVERNGFRYRPLPGGVVVRFGPRATDRQRAVVDAAARVTGCRLVVSESADESSSSFAARIAAAGVDRYRPIGLPFELDVVSACHRGDVAVDDSEPVGAPEIELPRWLREQSVTITTHRHGRVETRAIGDR